MAARRRFNQGGGQKDADAPSNPARSSQDGEEGEYMGLKVFVVVETSGVVGSCDREERLVRWVRHDFDMHCNTSSYQMSFLCTDYP